MTERRSGLLVWVAFAHVVALETWFVRLDTTPVDAVGVRLDQARKDNGVKGDADQGRGDRRRALSRMDRRKTRNV